MESIKTKITQMNRFLTNHEDLISGYSFIELRSDLIYLAKNLNPYDIETTKRKLIQYELIPYIKTYFELAYDYVLTEFNRYEGIMLRNVFIDDFDLI